MINTIVYTSNTGTTKEYAVLLGKKTGLDVCSIEESKGKLSKGTQIIYLGWVMASGIKGYKKAACLYQVKAVCGVCMGATGSQMKEIREKNNIPSTTPLFTMQGGFDIKKLHGIYKMMMNMMSKIAGKAIADKKDRTPDEDVMLEMMLHGGNFVSEENIKEVLSWYNGQK